jgi:hypothetical protein
VARWFFSACKAFEIGDFIVIFTRLGAFGKYRPNAEQQIKSHDYGK